MMSVVFDPTIFDCTFKSKVALGRINCRRNGCYTYLKRMLTLCLKKALMGDTLAVLPTGFGKSLIFEMLPLMMSTQTSMIEEQVQR